jgi:GNAT superfamily N-acetyltransferase
MASINRYSLFLLRERRNLLRVCLNENNNQIALMRFSTPELDTRNSNTAYLHNVEVAKTHQNSRIGSRLLEKMDLYLKINNPEVNKIKGVLWDDQSNPYLHHFFRKNGYDLEYNLESVYDDGNTIIDVIPLTKNL